MRYVIARYQEYKRDMAYRFYVTDCLQTITLNTAKYSGGNYMLKRFADVVTPDPAQTIDKTAEEIIADVVKRAGLEVV